MSKKKIKRQAYGQVIYKMVVGFDSNDEQARLAVRSFAASKHSSGVTAMTTLIQEHANWITFTTRYESHCSEWTEGSTVARFVAFMKRRGIERGRFTRIEAEIERTWIGLFCDVHGIHCHSQEHQTDRCNCMPGFETYEDADCIV